MKGGYDHFVQKEIREQPKTLARTMHGSQTMTLTHVLCAGDRVVIPFGSQRVNRLSWGVFRGSFLPEETGDAGGWCLLPVAPPTTRPGLPPNC